MTIQPPKNGNHKEPLNTLQRLARYKYLSLIFNHVPFHCCPDQFCNLAFAKLSWPCMVCRFLPAPNLEPFVLSSVLQEPYLESWDSRFTISDLTAVFVKFYRNWKWLSSHLATCVQHHSSEPGSFTWDQLFTARSLRCQGYFSGISGKSGHIS